MLPFPIISTYGNIIQNKIIIKKYTQGRQHCAAIDSKNNLWYLGYNGYGGAGDGTTVSDFNNFKLIRSDVVNYWCNATYGTSVIKTIDGKILWCGSRGWMDGNWPGSANTTWTEIPFLSSKDVKHIQVGDRFMIAQVGTQLYAYGVNANGIFNANAVVPLNSLISQWTLISGTYTVQDFTVNGGNTYINTGTLVMACGTNTQNVLGSGSTTSVLTFSTLSGAGVMSNALSYPYKAASYGNIIKHTSGIIYGRGSGTGYQLGNGSTTTLTTGTNISSFWPEYSTINTLSYAGWESQSPQCGFYISGTNVYGYGTQTYGELGTGDSAVKTTPVRVPYVLDAGESFVGIAHSSDMSTIYTTKRAWSAGRFFNGTAFVNLLTFVPHPKLPEDWIFDFDPNVRPWY